METTILSNGLKIIYYPKESNTVCIEVNVRTGSNNEEEEVAGISHFIEHMLFEGTKKRPDSFLISNEIEKLGGELNAATSNDRTFFYTRVPSKHFDIALEVLSDIISNPLFNSKKIEKEKNIVRDEIKLVNDQPRYFQWIMFQKALYRDHPAGRPIYGYTRAIEELDRKKVTDYYSRFYNPDNMTIVIVGDVKDVFSKVEKSLSTLKGPKTKKQLIEDEDKHAEPVTKQLNKDTLQAYSILGYCTVNRKHKDSYVLDVIRAVAGRGQSGKIFNEIRTKRGLAYDVGVYHSPNSDFGFFAVYVNTNKKNLEKVKEIIIKELIKIKKITPEELGEAKTFLEGDFLLQSEDNLKLADMLAFWDQADSAESVMEYVKNIKKVTIEDISQVVDKYFKNHTMTVIY